MLCPHAVPAEIAVPGFAARSGFAGSLGYWLAVHVYAALTPAEGRALVISLAVLHGLLVDLFGWHFDFTHPAAYLAHALGNVPMPAGGGAAAKGGAVAAASSKVSAPADHSARRRVVESKKGR